MSFFSKKPKKEQSIMSFKIDLTDGKRIEKSLNDIFENVYIEDIPLLVLAIYENIDDPEEKEIFRMKADDLFKKAATDEIAKSIGW
jgi:hypothetical protein